MKYRLFGKNISMKGLSGYMTVEASVIIPLTFICFIVIIYHTFFLYNHLIVYQSCYLAGLRGSRIKNATSEAVEQYVNKELDILLKEQIFQNKTDYRAKVGTFRISISASTELKEDDSVLMILNNGLLRTDREAEVIRLDPTDYIRNSERFKQQ